MTRRSNALLFAVLLSHVVEECSAFKGLPIMSGVIRSSSSSSHLDSTGRDYLHEAEYPGDDFTHTLGFSDCDHQPSKLQQIATNTLKDVTRNKLPVDTVSFSIYSASAVVRRLQQLCVSDLQLGYNDSSPHSMHALILTPILILILILLLEWIFFIEHCYHYLQNH